MNSRRIKQIVALGGVALWAGFLACGSGEPEPSNEQVEVEGLVLPIDDEEFAVRDGAGDTRVRWTGHTRVGREIQLWRYLWLDTNALSVDDVSTADTRDRTFVDLGGEVRIILTVDHAGWQAALASGTISPGNDFELSVEDLPEHAPTADDPRLVATLSHRRRGNANMGLTVGNTELTLAGGLRLQALSRITPIYGTLTLDDIVPLRTIVSVRGTLEEDSQGSFVRATSISARPVPDPVLLEDPALPRLLVIGDSISAGYEQDLRDALAGQVNVAHPPANAGSSSNGREQIRVWLGAHQEAGRGWDAVAFNFGHWDSTDVPGPPRTAARSQYQSNLEFIIEAIQETGARLLWITTTPNPLGYGEGDMGRKSGRNRLLNEWAAEGMSRHPEIEVVDLFGVVETNPLYDRWWKRRNVHFTRVLNPPLARAVSRGVLEALGQGDSPLSATERLSPEVIEASRKWLTLEIYEQMLEEARS